MTSSYPTLTPVLSNPPPAKAGDAARPALLGLWRYPAVRRPRGSLIFALLVSAAIHGGLLLGIPRYAPARPHVEEEHTIALNLPPPIVPDLDEPEPIHDDTAEKVDLSDLAPTLPDVPQIALPNDFQQQINFASLLPRPDLSEAKMFVIPPNVLRSGKIGEGMTNLFNLADLDRVPEPLVQQAPVFPFALKREVLYARVIVFFIVDVDGRVVNATPGESTHDGFNEAAVTGVMKWRFRPGMRGGRRVNTRMSVPIIFRISDPQ